MKKLIILIIFCSSFSLSYSQSLANTEWYFLRGSNDTVRNVYGTDTAKLFDNTGRLLLEQWFKVQGDTIYFVDLTSGGCPVSDTGIYKFQILSSLSNNTDSLSFQLIDDLCAPRGDALPNRPRWRNASSTGILLSKERIAFDMFPNPSSGQFFIESTENATFKLIDKQGKIVQEDNVFAGRNEYSLNVVPGLYFLLMVYQNEAITRKVIVN